METIKNRYINTARFYDLDQRDNLIVDIPFYLDYAKNYNGNILELGCGTGRVSIELAKAGHFVTGLDLSDSMLEIHNNKLEKLPKETSQKINLIKGNMADFDIDNKFSLIISPFRAFQSLTNDIDINNSLKCIKKHLNKNGIFIINVFRPSKILDESWCSGENVQWETEDWILPDEKIHVVKKDYREKIDTINQIIYPKFIYEITDKNGNKENYTEYLELKYYYYNQLKTLLQNNEFKIFEEYGWYDKSPIENGRELIIVCG